MTSFFCCKNKDGENLPTPGELGLTEEEAEKTVQSLLVHGYHLPKHSWWGDLWQYMTNNHPLIGVLLHHPLHPLNWQMRVAVMIGSILMGLAITCLIYVAFVFSNQDYDQEYIELKTNATRTGIQEDLDDNVSTLSVTSGNIALWTVGAFLHGLYDNCVWALAAGTCCECCRKKDNDDTTNNNMSRRDLANKTKSTRFVLVMLSVILVVAITFFAVSLQMALSTDDETEITVLDASASSSSSSSSSFNFTTATNLNSTDSYSNSNNPTIQKEQLFQIKTDSASDYEFILAYLVELGLSYFLYYPLIGTLMFSGILSCGRSRLLGGRPYELRHATESGQDVEDGRQSTSAKPGSSVLHSASAHSKSEASAKINPKSANNMNSNNNKSSTKSLPAKSTSASTVKDINKSHSVKNPPPKSANVPINKNNELEGRNSNHNKDTTKVNASTNLNSSTNKMTSAKGANNNSTKKKPVVTTTSTNKKNVVAHKTMSNNKPDSGVYRNSGKKPGATNNNNYNNNRKSVANKNTSNTKETPAVIMPTDINR